MSTNQTNPQNLLPEIVVQGLKTVYKLLGQLAGNDLLFSNTIATAFGKSADATAFQTAWANGDFSSFPEIEIRSSSEINGANGAFAAATGKIYLAQEFIDANVNNLQAITAILLEEYGHYVDSQINTTDSAGDEGDIFARLVQGKSISESELAVLKAEDDHATVTLDGQVVEIEQNVSGAYKSVLWWIDNVGDGNGNKGSMENYKSFSSQLAFARQKILNTTIPFHLRAVSYLRISCSIMQKFHCLESENHSIKPQKTPYLSLLNSLSGYQVEWWNNCQISEEGILTSTLAEIDLLLQPLTQLHQQQLDI